MKKLLLGLSVLVVLLLSGCTLNPQSLYVGQGESLAQLKRACNMNDGKRCVTLGINYVGLRDFQNARKYFDKACKLHVAEGCYNLGIIYNWEKKHKDIDRKAKQEYIKKGCTMGVSGRCSSFLGHYGTKQTLFDIVYPDDINPPDVSKLKKACSSNDSAACVKVGVIYFRGFDVKQDSSEARKYFKKACDLNNDIGCRWGAWTYVDWTTGWSQNINWPEKGEACDLNNVAGCLILEDYYRKGYQGISIDEIKAMEYFRKACGLNQCKKYEQLK